MGSWQDTRLWRKLKSKKGDAPEAVKTRLRDLFPTIETTLAHQSQRPPFTLHDNEHGFRVAERMVDVMPKATFAKLNHFELGLLLLAAYLHDIGMSPALHKVQDLFDYFCTGKRSAWMEDSDLAGIQEFLDDWADGKTVPLLTSPTDANQMARIRKLVAFYCRNRHNDWSEAWIREHLTGKQLGSYDAWVDHLVDICRSHHEGIEALRNSRFDPIAPVSNSWVHRRYLACLLRVADILEFDPERAPPELFESWEIKDDSVQHWERVRCATLHCDNGTLALSAEPERAYVHKSLLTMADEIDAELRLCRQLDIERPFHSAPVAAVKLPHAWQLPLSIERNIRPKAGTYEYIEGAFRPDTGKLLELLGGQALYGDPLVAVRELLQNAFDAIREEAALIRLREPDCSTPECELRIAQQFSVDLRFERTGDEWWLVCKDNGIGMSKAIITNHLLVSGSGPRHEVRDLERRCQNKGFHLGRTGQFGIGTLSYFMLADKVVIETRRSQLGNDNEGHGWRFETTGAGAFGELRSFNNPNHGTTVRLRLRRDLVANAEEWYSQLVGTIQKTLVRIPSVLRLTTDLPAASSLDLKPGWVRSTESIHQLIKAQSQWREPETALLEETRQRNEKRREDFEEFRSLAAAALRTTVHERSFENGTVVCRCHIPWYELPEGHSVGFVLSGSSKAATTNQYCDQVLVPEPELITAWKGMRIAIEPGNEQLKSGSLGRHVILEMDWLSDPSPGLRVSRQTMSPSTAGSQMREEVLVWVKNTVDDTIDSWSRCQFDTIADSLYQSARTTTDWYWMAKSQSGDSDIKEWRKLTAPVAEAVEWISPNWLKTQAVDRVTDMEGFSRTKSLRPPFIHLSMPRLNCHFNILGPVYLIWDDKAFSPALPNRNPSRAAIFASHLSNLVGYRFHHAFLWNSLYLPPGQFTPSLPRYSDSVSNHLLLQNPPKTPAEALTWLATIVLKKDRDLWFGLWQTQRDIMEQAWGWILNSESHATLCMVDAYNLIAFSSTLYVVTSEPSELSKYLVNESGNATS